MVAKKAKINIYQHSIDISQLTIKNQSREEFRVALEKIKYKGYEVENISDGRKIVVTKPGVNLVLVQLKEMISWCGFINRAMTLFG